MNETYYDSSPVVPIIPPMVAELRFNHSHTDIRICIYKKFNIFQILLYKMLGWQYIKQ